MTWRLHPDVSSYLDEAMEEAIEDTRYYAPNEPAQIAHVCCVMREAYIVARGLQRAYVNE